MAQQICIKTPSGMWCSASAITAYSGPTAVTSDPYPRDTTANINLDRIEDLAREIETQLLSAQVGGISLDGKGEAVLKTVKLMLLADVKPNETFVVLGMAGMQ